MKSEDQNSCQTRSRTRSRNRSRRKKNAPTTSKLHYMINKSTGDQNNRQESCIRSPKVWEKYKKVLPEKNFKQK